MTAINNKTQRPLSIPLPGGKTLHLGPGKTGQISAPALDSPGLKKLVDAGEIEVVNEDLKSTSGPGGGKRGPASMHGRTSGRRHGGDR
jgi:hypothetical protein